MATKQDLLNQMADVEMQADAIATAHAATGVQLDALRVKHADLRELISALQDAPTHTKLAIYIGRERLWFKEHAALRIDKAEARALRQKLGITGMRMFVDVSAINPKPGVYDFRRLAEDTATLLSEDIHPLFDFRYAPLHAVELRQTYAEQCRVCSHARHANPCPECAAIVAGKKPMPDLWKRHGVVLHPDHDFWLANPKSAYLEGQWGALMWNNWRPGPDGSDTHYAEELEYLQAGKVPHLIGSVFEALGREIASTFGSDVSVSPWNEPQNPRYFPPAKDPFDAWNEPGSTHDKYNRVLAATVKRGHDEMVIPLVRGLRSVPAGRKIQIVGPAGDTDTIIRAILADEAQRSERIYDGIGGHPYGWSDVHPDPLVAAVKRAEAMLLPLREYANGRSIVFDEFDDKIARNIIAFATWCKAQGDIAMLNLHENRFWNEAELAEGNYVPTEIGRQLAELAA